MPRGSSWFNPQSAAAGARASFGVAGVVLCASAIGAGALAHDIGIGLFPTLFMTFMIWALPSQIILLTMMEAGASLPATALAVSLSAVRLMPMVTSLIPTIRTGQTPRWVQALIAHMTAATVWLEARRMAPNQKIEQRASYVLFMSFGLVAMLMVGVSVGFVLSGSVPRVLAAAMILITPIYFLVAMFMAAQIKADYISIGLGFALGPPFAYLVPELDLMIAGVIGGSLAFGFYWYFERSGQTPAAPEAGEGKP